MLEEGITYILHICSIKIFNFREVFLFTITTELYVTLVLWLVYTVVKIRVDHWLKPFYYHLLLVWRLISSALFRGRSFSVMAFENIFLKIDRERQHYQRVFAIKIIKKYGWYRRNYQKVETRFSLASVHQGSEFSLCSVHFSKRNYSIC